MVVAVMALVSRRSVDESYDNCADESFTGAEAGAVDGIEDDVIGPQASRGLGRDLPFGPRDSWSVQGGGGIRGEHLSQGGPDHWPDKYPVVVRPDRARQGLPIDTGISPAASQRQTIMSPLRGPRTET